MSQNEFMVQQLLKMLIAIGEQKIRLYMKKNGFQQGNDNSVCIGCL